MSTTFKYLRSTSLTLAMVATGCGLFFSPRDLVAELFLRSRSTTVAKSLNELRGTILKWDSAGSGPTCGVFSSCVALRQLGIDVSPGDYIKSKYIGQAGGSTPAEVARIVEDAGGFAEVLTGLSLFDLKMMNGPFIANVRATPNSDQFDHWSAVARDNGDILVYDATGQCIRTSESEFSALWSGVGIAVKKAPGRELYKIWLGRGLALQILLLGCICVKSFLHSHVKGLSKQIGCLLVLTVLLTLGGNLLYGDLWRHSRGARIAMSPFLQHHIKQGSLADAERAASDPSVLLVDARLEEDYRDGNIRQSVNIPVHASPWAMREYLSGIATRTPIVVYCQSARCKYADHIARRLASIGFSDITVCDKGWAEYQREMKKR